MFKVKHLYQMHLLKLCVANKCSNISKRQFHLSGLHLVVPKYFVSPNLERGYWKIVGTKGCFCYLKLNSFSTHVEDVLPTRLSCFSKKSPCFLSLLLFPSVHLLVLKKQKLLLAVSSGMLEALVLVFA